MGLGPKVTATHGGITVPTSTPPLAKSTNVIPQYPSIPCYCTPSIYVAVDTALYILRSFLLNLPIEWIFFLWVYSGVVGIVANAPGVAVTIGLNLVYLPPVIQ